MTRITLEQWRMFVATAQQGSFLQAAEKLGKTQSAISHAIRKMEETLGQELFAIEGRRARLTTVGEMIYPRARELIGHAAQIERLCVSFDPEAEGEISIAVDVIFPMQLLHRALEEYEKLYPHFSVRVWETTLSGASEILEDGRAVIGIAGQLPPGTVMEPLLEVSFLCVAVADHPLHREGDLTHAMLKEHRQIVLSDSGRRNLSSGWLGARKRWTVGHLATSVALVRAGQGYAWLPEHSIGADIAAGTIRPLRLHSGGRRTVQLHLGYTEIGQNLRQALDLLGVFRDTVADHAPLAPQAGFDVPPAAVAG